MIWLSFKVCDQIAYISLVNGKKPRKSNPRISLPTLIVVAVLSDFFTLVVFICVDLYPYTICIFMYQ